MDNDQNGQLDWQGVEYAFLEKIADYSDLYFEVPSKVGYQSTLEKISESMIRFKKPEHLIKMIVRVIDREVGVMHAAVLLHNEAQQSFILTDSKGEEGKRVLAGRLELSVSNPLITVFTEEGLSPLLDENGVLTYELVEKTLNNKEFLSENPHLNENLKKIKEEMDILDASICIPSYFKKGLMGILLLGDKLSGEKFTRKEIEFFLTLANDAAMAISNAQLIENLQQKVKEIGALYERANSLFIRISIALATAIDARDPYTHGHTVRVTAYCLSIAEGLRSSRDFKAFQNFRESLHIAALLHDIGKIGIPDNILHKKEELTQQEREKIQEHPAIGATILYPIRELEHILGAVRAHQERFDGNGYPDRLKGENIPLMARIIAVADAFDAITSDRPYRNKRTHQEAISEIKKCSGTQFDPQIAEVFVRTYEKNQFSNYI